MSFPGWLPAALEFKELPVRHPLPVVHEAFYKEGSDGTILRNSGAKWRADWVFIDTGMRLEEGYGVDGETPVLNAILRQPNVFGVLLFDWYRPPAKLQTGPFERNNINQPVDGVGSGSTPVHTPVGSGTTPTFTEAG
jgi:hypothetical protein